MVEHVEIHKMMGVKKYYVYYDDATADVRKVLKYYQNQSSIEVFDFPIHKGVNPTIELTCSFFANYYFQIILGDAEYTKFIELQFYGCAAAVNDCVNRVRVVDNVKYIAIIDFDEFLMTFNDTLLDFIHKKDNGRVNSIRFQNIFLFSAFKHIKTAPESAGRSLI